MMNRIFVAGTALAVLSPFLTWNAYYFLEYSLYGGLVYLVFAEVYGLYRHSRVMADANRIIRARGFQPGPRVVPRELQEPYRKLSA